MVEDDQEETQDKETQMKTESNGKLRIALERLLWRYPLLGGLVATWDHRPVGTDTVAIGMGDQGFILYYCPDFVAETSIDQLVGVLHHEVRHVIYGHVMMDPDEFANKEALLIAQEVTVNEGLPEPLPEGAVRLKDFPKLPPDEDTLTRYDRLRQESDMSLQSESDKPQQGNQGHEPDKTSQDEGDSQQGESGEKPESESANTPRGDEGDSQQGEGEGGEKSDSESGDAPKNEKDSTPQGEVGKTTEGESGKPSKDEDDGSQRGEGNNMPDGESTDTSQGDDGGAPQDESNEKPDGESADTSQDESDGAQQDTGGENAEGESDKASMDEGDESQQDEGAEKADSKSIDDPEGDDTNTPPGKGGEKEVDESGRPSQDDGDGSPQDKGGETAEGEGGGTPDSESARASQSEGDGPQQDKGDKTPVDESEKTSKSKGAGTPQGEGGAPAEGRSGEPSQAQGGMPVSGKDWDDDHGHWQEIRDHGSHAKNLVDIAVQGFLAGSEQRPSTEDAEMDAVDLACQAWGITPGKELTQLPDVQREPTVDWRRILRRRVGRLMTKRPTYSRPPRRFPDLIGIVPGTAQSATKPTIMAVIDTSLSMSDEMLGEISRELQFLTRDHQVVVVECDVTIQAVYPYRPIVCVAGRGGTDFRPPLERAFLRKHAVDLVVFFTDGEGPVPEYRPYVPVIWTLTPDGTPPAPWGEVLRMG